MNVRVTANVFAMVGEWQGGGMLGPKRAAKAATIYADMTIYLL